MLAIIFVTLLIKFRQRRNAASAAQALAKKREHRRALAASRVKPVKPVILFASVAHAGQANPVLALAEEVAYLYPEYEIHIMSHSFYEKKIKAQVPSCKFIDLGGWDFPTNIKKPEYFNQFKGKPCTVSCPVFAVKLINQIDQYEKEHKIANAYFETTAPVLTVVDALTNSVLDTVVDWELPYAINVPCNPYMFFLKPRLFPDPTYPALGTGFPRHMSLTQTIRNFFYLHRVC